MEVECLLCHAVAWKSYDNLKAKKSSSCPACSYITNRKYSTKLELAAAERGGAAKSRCRNERDAGYSIYGGRGIEFRFDSIEEYVRYVVSLPNANIALEVDRIDNMGHYKVGNLRWISRHDNLRNTRRNRWVEYENTSYVLYDFVRNFTDLSLATANRYLMQGYTPSELRRIVQTRESGRPSIRHYRCERGEQLRGCYDDPIYV